MPESLRALFQDTPLPFFLSAIQAGGSARVNLTRIMESLIIAGAVVLAGYVFLVPEIQANQKAMAVEISKLSTEVIKLREGMVDTRVRLVDGLPGKEHRQYVDKHNRRHLGEWREHRSVHTKGVGR